MLYPSSCDYAVHGWRPPADAEPSREKGIHEIASPSIRGGGGSLDAAAAASEAGGRRRQWGPARERVIESIAEAITGKSSEGAMRVNMSQAEVRSDGRVTGKIR